MVGCNEGQMLTDCISPEGKVMRNQLQELICRELVYGSWKND